MGYVDRLKLLYKNVKETNSTVKALQKQVDALQEKNEKLTNLVNVHAYQRDLMFWQLYQRDNETLQEAKQRFFAALPKSTGEMALKQSCINILLREFGRVCHENDIPYWLDYGTLLGALRHKGFIPWDDDADVGMMRKDLPRVKEAFKDSKNFEFIEFLAVTDRSVCEIYRIGFRGVNNPCFVDIFVYDYCTKNGLDDDETWAAYRRCRRELVRRGDKLWTAEDREQSPFANEPDAAVRDTVASESACSAIREIKDEMFDRLKGEIGLTEEPADSIIWGLDNLTFKRKYVFQTSTFFPLKELEFEGVTYKVPQDYESYLFGRYGDIWALPNNIYTHQHMHLGAEYQRNMTRLLDTYGE